MPGKAQNKKQPDPSCSLCEYTAATESLMKKHMKSVHTELYSLLTFVEEENLFKCNKCDFTAAQRLTVLRHIKDKHDIAGIYIFLYLSFL